MKLEFIKKLTLGICFCLILLFGLWADADLCSKQDLSSNYSKDCALKLAFESRKSCFAENKKNIDNVQVYRALRLLDRKDYETKKSTQKLWEMYTPAPKTWVFWENANFYRNRLQIRLTKSRKKQVFGTFQ